MFDIIASFILKKYNKNAHSDLVDFANFLGKVVIHSSENITSCVNAANTYATKILSETLRPRLIIKQGNVFQEVSLPNTINQIVLPGCMSIAPFTRLTLFWLRQPNIRFAVMDAKSSVWLINCLTPPMSKGKKNLNLHEKVCAICSSIMKQLPYKFSNVEQSVQAQFYIKPDLNNSNDFRVVDVVALLIYIAKELRTVHYLTPIRLSQGQQPLVTNCQQQVLDIEQQQQANSQQQLLVPSQDIDHQQEASSQQQLQVPSQNIDQQQQQQQANSQQQLQVPSQDIDQQQRQANRQQQSQVPSQQSHDAVEAGRWILRCQLIRIIYEYHQQSVENCIKNNVDSNGNYPDGLVEFSFKRIAFHKDAPVGIAIVFNAEFDFSKYQTQHKTLHNFVLPILIAYAQLYCATPLSDYSPGQFEDDVIDALTRKGTVNQVPAPIFPGEIGNDYNVFTKAKSNSEWILNTTAFGCDASKGAPMEFIGYQRPVAAATIDTRKMQQSSDRGNDRLSLLAAVATSPACNDDDAADTDDNGYDDDGA